MKKNILPLVCKHILLRLSAWILLVAIAGPLPLSANEDAWLLPTNAPDKAARQTINSSQSHGAAPGHPHPPIRISERKKVPQPDVLIAKVKWGLTASNNPVSDWDLATNDFKYFMETGSKTLGMTYAGGVVTLDSFSYDPSLTPALLISGVRTFKLTETEHASLKSYIQRGGMVICDSVYGSPYFYDSCKKVFQDMFPSKALRVIPGDHPLFDIYEKITEMSYPEEPERKEPHMEGIYVGSRVGVLISKYGLGPGWTGNTEVVNELKKRGLKPQYIAPNSAKQFGINLYAYIVGYGEVGKIEGTPEVFLSVDEKRPTDEFVFAQIEHEGAWDVHPTASATLLSKLRQESAVRVNLKRIVVHLDKDELSAIPFLYLTGLDDFTFSPTEVEALRQYLKKGGKLFINNGLGLAAFHQAVMREMEKVLEGKAKMMPIPAKHEIFSSLKPIKEVEYTDALLAINPELKTRPNLLGVEGENGLQIIYSPYDIEAGWLDAFYPLMRGLKSPSATDLGMNIVTYMMMY